MLSSRLSSICTIWFHLSVFGTCKLTCWHDRIRNQEEESERKEEERDREERWGGVGGDPTTTFCLQPRFSLL